MLLRELLNQHAQSKPSFGNIEVETIFDVEHDRYQIVHMGWSRWTDDRSV